MTEPPEIAAARAEVERSRSRLISTAHDLQERLSPRTLARSTWEGAKTKGADLAEDAVDAVRSRPYAATGVVAAIAMFLARQPLRRERRREFPGGDSLVIFGSSPVSG